MNADELTEREEFVVNELLPATSGELADSLEITRSTVWDIAQNLREKGLDVSQDSQGRYFIPGVAEDPSASSYTDARRITSQSKAAITRKVKEYLAEVEEQLQEELDSTEPAVVDGGLATDEGNQDFIGHFTDIHFGQVIRNQHGEETYNSDIAEARFRQLVGEGLNYAENRRTMGVTFDNAHFLLGGDIITNENIYDGQAHEIDETLREQIRRAANVVTWGIRRYSNSFDRVQVVCTPGNHGELRSGNASNHANADTILYDMVELAVRESDIENVHFVRSDAVYYVNFPIRDWNAHMRHGHDASLEHIGTSAGKQRWGQWLIDHDFDVAFRGHYHLLKEEPIAGRQVLMGGSPAPQSGFEESHAMSGRPIAAVHGATDRLPAQWTERVTF